MYILCYVLVILNDLNVNIRPDLWCDTVVDFDNPDYRIASGR